MLLGIPDPDPYQNATDPQHELICFAPMLGPGTHVHVLPAWQPALARPQGGHPQGALPEDRRHQARHAHRGQ
jgi:hypothetical protein